MKLKLLVILAALLATLKAPAQFVLDCACLAQLPGMTVTNCLATVPDLCAVVTNCFRSTIQPPPPLIIIQCSQTPAAGSPIGPGTHVINLTVQLAGVPPVQCAVPFQVIPPITGPFSLQCASNKTVSCDAPWSFDPPTPVNPCCPNPALPNGGVVITELSTTTNGVCPQVITRTWQGVDNCGQTATCSQTVTVVDNVPPTINCGQNEFLQCGLAWGFTFPIVSDNCTAPADLVLTIVSTVTNLTCPPTFVATRVWQVTDLCGNSTTCTQVVTIIDNVAPTLTCASNKTVECGSGWTFDTPTATDFCISALGSGAVTVSVLSTVTNGACPEVITRTWSATDGCGNSNTCSQTVTVVDTTPPVLDCACLTNNPGVLLTVVACSNAIPDLCKLAIGPAPSCASDNCGPLTCAQSPAPGTIVGPGTYPITLTVYDCASNAASCVVAFTVVEPPGGCSTNPCPDQLRVWNTGMDGTNALASGQTDPNYVFISGPPGGCNGPAQVIDPSSVPGSWVPNGPDSQWIGPAQFVANCAEGVYHYRLCFYLPCTDGAAIIGRWTADDLGQIFLNGQPTGQTVPSVQVPNASFTSWHPVAITNGFVCGTNCLDFYVTNAVIYTGFRAELTNVFNDCCCEPLQEISTDHSGADSSGLLPLFALDPQLVLTCVPPGAATGPSQIIIPNGLWIPNGPDSQWVGPVGAPSVPGGLYCYEYRFNLPPCTNGTPNYSVTGQWAGDDAGTIYANGLPTGNNLPNGWAFTNWHPINITSGLVPGPNTLTFFVTNGSFGDTGIRVELTNSAACCDCTNLCTVSISCTNDFTRETCGNVAHILYPLPTATSSCGAPVSVVCSPPSNTVFPLGMTTVTCTGTDPMGNSATCSFKVTVLPDSTPPTIDCTCVRAVVPPRVNACYYTVPDLCQLRQCFSDNCTLPEQLTCTQSPPAGTVLPAGASYVITLTITDAAGNMSAACQVGVSVIAPTDTRVWNTGMGGTSGNIPLPAGTTDPNFALVSFPSGGCPGPAQVINNVSIPVSWLPNTGDSRWIGPGQFVNNCAPGLYHYRLSFNLPCAQGAAIVGQISADDIAAVHLNGTPTGITTAGFGVWTPVSITGGFVNGPNVLDVFVTNAIIYTGLRAELTNTFNCCCPEAIALNCPRTPVRGWVCGDGIVHVPFNVTASSLCPGTNITVGVVCVPPSPGPFPVGTTTVNCTATDSLGNTKTCSFPVVVVSDTTPPVLTCPGPITRVICANSVPVYYKATARDDCSPTVSIVCLPPSGSVFGVGTTSVTCSATDACGNIASCSFPVKVINNLIWQLLPCGVNDCYAQSGFEPNTQGACLTTAYPAGLWKNFDNTTVNRWVGHTWTFPINWNIVAAQLATRVRPPVNGCAGISDNDSIQLGLANCSPATWLWSRYLGSGNASPGLVDRQWCNGMGCNYPFNFDLASLPLTPSGTTSLLPHMNSTKRLDFFVQDDSTVDYVDLRVRRCAPPHVIGGIGTELFSGQLVYGPINWCLIRDTAATASFRAEFRVGEADGLRLPLEPLQLSEHPGAALALGEVVDGAPVDRLRAALQPDGNVLVSLGELPEGVTHVDVDLEVNGQVVQSFPNVPVTSGRPLVNFPAIEPVIELGTANGDELLLSILSQEPDQPAEKQTLRVRYLARSKRSEAELNLRVAGLPEIGLGQPELSYRRCTKPPCFRETPTRVSVVGDGLMEISGGQCVVNPLHEDGGFIGVNALFGSTDEFRAVIPPLFGDFGPTPSNAVFRSSVRGLIDGENVLVDQLDFTHNSGVFDVTWSSARLHPARRIYIVYGPSGSHRFEVPGNSNLVVEVPELPTMLGKLGGRTPCRRIIWPKPVQLRVAGGNVPGGEVTLEAIELRILVETDDYPVTALTGLRLEANGAESVKLDALDTGAEEYRLDFPELTPDGVWLRWSGFGGVLEEATDLLGPWAPTPGQFEHTQGEVLTPHDAAARAKFFRVRGF